MKERARAAAHLSAVLLLVLAGCAGSGRSPVPRAGEGELPVRSIAADETWSGVVTVTGSVVVPKGVTLSILPGTVVRFEKIDVDGDGIGDSELYVEGSLFARGTKDRPILFTSASGSPAPRDWKYLMIHLSRESVLSHCISEYAYSGLQVHFARAEVTYCLFRNNVDGLRFSTAEGTFSKNRMTGNVYGVRYKERNTGAVLSGNDITGNKVGIFCVLESTGRLAIRGNRIHGNSDYGFKLGSGQRADIPAQGNWWGTSDPLAIRDTIFDRARDPELGTVLFEPFLSKPPQEDAP